MDNIREERRKEYEKLFGMRSVNYDPITDTFLDNHIDCTWNGYQVGCESCDEEIKKLRDERTELKDAYAETFEKYIPVNKLSEANEFLLSRFKDYKMSKDIVDRIAALKDSE